MKVPTEMILKGLSKASKHPEGFTSIDLAVQEGKCQNWAQELIRNAWREGLVTCAGRRPLTKVDGTNGYAPIYKLVKK